MKRDVELLRELLLYIQDQDTFTVPWNDMVRAVKDYEQREIVWHLNLLEEAGLTTWVTEPVQVGPDEWDDAVLEVRITWKGYDFLAEASNSSFWEGAKRRAGDAFSSLSLGTLTALLQSVAKQQLGLS